MRERRLQTFSASCCGFGHDHVGQFGKQSLGFFPTEAGVSDGDAVGQGDTLFPGLLAGVEIAFEHQAHDGLAAVAELAEDVARN